MRIRSGRDEANTLALSGSSGSLTLEFFAMLDGPAVLVRQAGSEPPVRQTLEPWDPHQAIFASMLAATGRGGAVNPPGPSLHDATRAMELAEATARSLRKGRTVDLHYERISEEASFKSVMTSTGCMLFIGSLLVLPLALAGPPLGFAWTIYIAYLIPVLLVLFVILQTLRFAVRKAEQEEPRQELDTITKA